MFVLVLFFEKLGVATIGAVSAAAGLGCGVAATLAYRRARARRIAGS